MNKILVFGANGYLGSNLISFLDDQGHDVTLARRHGSLSINSNFKHIDIINYHERFLIDILNDFQTIIYASGANSRECEDNPKEALISNFINPQKIIKAATKSNVSSFIYFSSIHVYAREFKGSYNELSQTSNFHPYSLYKIGIENYLKWCSERSNLNVIINRISNCYGFYDSNSNISWNLVVNEFCNSAILERKITINSKFNSLRNYISVNDFMKILNHQLKNINSFSKEQVFNIVSNTNLDLLETANFISKRCKIKYGFSPKIIKSANFLESYDHALFSNKKLLNCMDVDFSSLEFEIDKLLDHSLIESNV
ncbi:SDR family oxidoreductase [Flavobacteriaceae bacterium]|nr:SDR family oxidoreductase [Flavobacteriaceae bacterium]